ncbi:phage GP46 family protein [Acinetobacter higginsii]|uniref:phage GP46 family protein n=1 Tax=Acinetobacter higginsii TaxID=70347 RepID=UPI001F4A8FA8|nr:phage GP46 family protein [Acinetobacter higginsii]MCH7381364.1 phage GP46 family protein [Acinetobacter higginsii]
MADIQTVWNTGKSIGEYALKNGSLQSGKDIETSVLISLFTDRLADVSDDLPDATTNTRADRRGWWGDTGQQYPIGSRLYLLDRQKAPLLVEKDAVNYATEALQWMIDDVVVASFDIHAKFLKPNQLRLTVTAYRQDGSVISKISEELW